uniref:Phospholipase A2 n=1 Tax=Sphenodon punctatus TaxID=8508 RepID=A0A8D0G7A8_SPHPU
CRTVWTMSACLPSPAHGSFLELRKMIKEVTKENAINSYAYGCYCGSGGHGEPKDATDWCCQAHKCCYKKLKASKCSGKTKCYSYTYKDGQVICGESAPYQVCACDKSFILCLTRNLGHLQ